MTFRAIGQEPGWSMEVREDSLVLLLDYGARRLAFADVQRSVTSGRTTYRATSSGHDLHVISQDTPCSDVMSGEAFEATVEVRLDEQVFNGCGRDLEAR